MKYISLGFNCKLPSLLLDLNLRKEAHIFDWLLSPNFNDIIYLFETKFSEIEITSNKTIKNTTIIDPGHYDITKWDDILHRRAQRLLDLLNEKEPILFIRDGYATFDQIKILMDIIDKNFNNKNIQILLSTYDNIKPQGLVYSLNNIHVYNITQFPADYGSFVDVMLIWIDILTSTINLPRDTIVSNKNFYIISKEEQD